MNGSLKVITGETNKSISNSIETLTIYRIVVVQHRNGMRPGIGGRFKMECELSL